MDRRTGRNARAERCEEEEEVVERPFVGRRTSSYCPHRAEPLTPPLDVTVSHNPRKPPAQLR